MSENIHYFLLSLNMTCLGKRKIYKHNLFDIFFNIARLISKNFVHYHLKKDFLSYEIYKIAFQALYLKIAFFCGFGLFRLPQSIVDIVLFLFQKLNILM